MHTFISLSIFTKLSVFFTIHNQIKLYSCYCSAKVPKAAKNPDSIDPESSWPALVLDDNVENVGIEVFVPSNFSDMMIYHVKPEQNSTKAIIVNYDIFGILSGRLKSVCDQIARDTGFHVLMPDFFRNNEGINEHGGLRPFTDESRSWLEQFDSKRILYDTDLVYKYMEDNGFEIDSYGSVGYCWGGWAGFQQASTGKIISHVSAHPSLKVENWIFGGSQEEMVKKVKSRNIMLLPAGNDPDNIKSGGDVENWVSNVAGKEIEIFEFPEMKHGFVPRGNVSISEVERDVKLAMQKTVDFLKNSM